MATQLVPEPTPEPMTLGPTLGRLAGVLASDNFPTGERAALKRMTPGQPPPLSFYRFAFRHLPEDWEKQSLAWMTLVTGLALMCPRPHRPDRAAGQALAEAGYSEKRLERLLAAEGDVLHRLTLRAARFLAAKVETINWTDLARLLLARQSGTREAARLHIARDYYRYLERKAQ